jgi:hypothetical protein
VQAEEFARERDGYTATKHQREAGTAYFDQLLMTITGGDSSTAALEGSTEVEQFREPIAGLGDVEGSPRGRKPRSSSHQEPEISPGQP